MSGAGGKFVAYYILKQIYINKINKSTLTNLHFDISHEKTIVHAAGNGGACGSAGGEDLRCQLARQGL